jgi:hypothetical protein
MAKKVRQHRASDLPIRIPYGMGLQSKRAQEYINAARIGSEFFYQGSSMASPTH